MEVVVVDVDDEDVVVDVEVLVLVDVEADVVVGIDTVNANSVEFIVFIAFVLYSTFASNIPLLFKVIRHVSTVGVVALSNVQKVLDGFVGTSLSVDEKLKLLNTALVVSGQLRVAINFAVCPVANVFPEFVVNVIGAGESNIESECVVII